MHRKRIYKYCPYHLDCNGDDYNQFALVVNCIIPYIRLAKKRGNYMSPCGMMACPDPNGSFAQLSSEEKEEKKRKEAEERAEKAEEDKREAERKESEERDKRRLAEIEKLRAENEKLKAEQKAKDETEKREEAEKQKEKISEELGEEKKKSAFKSALIGTDKEKIIGLQHQIAHSSSRINRNIKLLLKHLGENLDIKTKQYVSVMSLEANKVNSIANFITKANFNLTAEEIRTNIIDFINDYLHEIYLADDNILDANIKIEINKSVNSFDRKIVPLEITTLIDNFIVNAEKAKSKKIIFDFALDNATYIN